MDLRIFTEPQMGATYEQQLAVAQTAEAEGFDAFFRSDHYLSFGPDGAPGPTDSWVTLGAIARETTSIRLGTLVTAMTFRHPGVLAISVAQVDNMSGGRVELGIGAAWNDVEHRAYAIPFPPTGVRFEQLEDQLEIITRLWRTPAGETVDYAGAHHAVSDSPGLPKPTQSGGPPIIIGGGGPKKTPRLAARFADEYNLPFSPVDAFAAARDRVRSACDTISRDPDELVYSAALTTVVGADESEFVRRCEAIGSDPAGMRANGAGGTPEEVVAKLGSYRDAGAGRAYLQILDLDDLDHLRLIAAEVTPHL